MTIFFLLLFFSNNVLFVLLVIEYNESPTKAKNPEEDDQDQMGHDHLKIGEEGQENLDSVGEGEDDDDDDEVTKLDF